MSELVCIKLRNGDDLIAILISSNEDELTIENPVQIEVDPVHGFFAKSWLLLTRSNFVTLDKNDIIFFDDASDKAIRYYESFMHKLSMSVREEDSMEDFTSKHDDSNESLSDLEEMFISMIESKASTKH